MYRVPYYLPLGGEGISSCFEKKNQVRNKEGKRRGPTILKMELFCHSMTKIYIEEHMIYTLLWYVPEISSISYTCCCHAGLLVFTQFKNLLMFNFRQIP